MIQEQNSFAGITNKLLAKKVQKICVAYDGMQQFFPQEKIVKTGNPVRQDLLAIETMREQGIEKFGLKKDKKNLLILGGSLGARAINKLIDRELQFILDQEVQIIWQSGQLYYEEYKKHNVVEDVQVLPYIDTMNLAYAAADIIISRAGAGSVSELALVGKPVIFIPSPNVAEDHQTKNAQALAAKEAAIVVKDSEAKASLMSTALNILQDDKGRATLAKNARGMAYEGAARKIAEQVLALANYKTKK